MPSGLACSRGDRFYLQVPLLALPCHTLTSFILGLKPPWKQDWSRRVICSPHPATSKSSTLPRLLQPFPNHPLLSIQHMVG